MRVVNPGERTGGASGESGERNCGGLPQRAPRDMARMPIQSATRPPAAMEEGSADLFREGHPSFTFRLCWEV